MTHVDELSVSLKRFSRSMRKAHDAINGWVKHVDPFLCPKCGSMEYVQVRRRTCQCRVCRVSWRK